MLDWSLANLVAWAAQVALLVTAGILLPGLLRVKAPGARLLFLRALLVLCMVLPLVQPWAAVRVPPQVLAPTADLALSPDTVAATTGPAAALPIPAAAASPFSTIPWRSVAVVVLLAGAGIRLAWLAVGLVSLMRLRRSSIALEPSPAPVEDAALVVGARASFRLSARVPRPVTFGVRQPVVLVPEGFLEFAPAEQLAIACHELLHVRRRDWLRTLAEEVVCAVLWFHPAIWWLVDRIRLSVEQVIDRSVVRLLGDRRSYLHALLRLAASGPEPMLQPATLFLKHGHLQQRVALLVKETPMSRIRLAASLLVVLAVVGAGGWIGVQAFPLTTLVVAPAESVAVAVPPQTKPTVDPKAQAPKPGVPAGPVPGTTVDAATQEAKLLQAIQMAPAVSSNYFVLAKLYEDMGRFGQAEATLLKAKAAKPGDSAVLLQLAAYYSRQGQFEKSIAILTERAAVEPNNPEAQYIIATWYWDKAYRDAKLSDAVKGDYVAKGLAAVDAALRLKPDYVEAITYKSLLLRIQATLDADPAQQQALIKQADTYLAEAKALKQQRDSWAPADAVRVGAGIAPPRKVKDVKPIYPQEAQSARVQGVVIIEALIGTDGRVMDSRLLRSIPMLDQAALDAVKQWEFTPTLLNGEAIKVVMTVTVNFTLSDGPPSGALAGGVAGGVSGGVAGGVAGGLSAPPPPPPAPPLKAASGATPVRVGGNIRPPSKVKDVRAVYPEDAKTAGVQGVIIIEALINEAGKVESAKVLRSVPALDQAALDAVMQWEFTPTLLNGAPVPVVMIVTVNFTLQ